MIVEFEVREIYGVQSGFIVADTKNISLNSEGVYRYALLNGQRYMIKEEVYQGLLKVIKGTESVEEIWNTKKSF